MSKKISNNVRLEVDLLDDGRVRPSEDRQTTPPAGTLSILVVDDDPDMRKFVKVCLRRLDRWTLAILEAQNGQAALELARSQHFDLVISDVMMPRMSGADLCRELRIDPNLRHIRVLLMTGGLSASEIEGHAREADALILKPFNARQLCERVLHVFDRGPPAGST